MRAKTMKVLNLILVICMVLSLGLAVGCANKGQNKNACNVTFVLETQVTIQVNKGEKISQDKIPDTLKEDYEFLGWYNGNELFDVNSSVINSDVTLTAKYEKVNFSVIFITDSQVSLKLKKGNVIPSEAIPEVVEKEGFIFIGWYNGEELFEFDSEISEDLTLVATYESFLAVDKYNGKQINLLPDVIQEYFSKATEDEIAEYLYNYYESIQAGGAYESGPKPVKLSWRNHVEESSTYTLEVSSNDEFSDIEFTVTTTESQVEIYNLIPRVHYYRVSSSSGLVSEIDSFENVEQVRLINCGNIANMRDEGGYVGEFGKVNYGLVYRSKDICVANSTAKEVLVNQLGIKTQIDLRGDVTGLNSPDASIAYYNFGIKQYDYLFPNMNAGRPFNQTYAEGVKNALLMFADKANYPIVMHCAVGCDRTGTFALLLGGLLGLEYEDLVSDYELSSFFHGRRWRARINLYNGFYTFDTGNLPDELEAREFNRIFNHIKETYKTSDGKFSSAVEKYLINVVGIDKNDIEAIRANLIEGYTASYTISEEVKMDFAGSQKIARIPELSGKTVLSVKINGKEIDVEISNNGSEVEIKFLSFRSVGVGIFSLEVVCTNGVYVGTCSVQGKVVGSITNGGQFTFD